MNNNFRVIKGKKDENENKEIIIEREDKNQKIMNIRPKPYRIRLTETQLENLERKISEAKEYVEVTYSRYAERQKQAKENASELEEMFKDNDDIVVFDSYKYKK